MKFLKQCQKTLPGNLAESNAIFYSMATAFYTVLALIMTWPLASEFFSFVAAGREDGAMSVWTLWWSRFALIDLGQNPLHTTYLFFPEGASMVFHSIPKVLALVSIPLQYVLGLTAAYNLIFLLTFVGSGVAACLLINHLTENRYAALLGGAFFAFCPYRWGQWSHLALLSTMMIPLFMLLVIKGWEAVTAGERRAWGLFALGGVVLAVQSYDTEHYTISLLLLSGLFVIYQLPFSRSREDLGKWLRLSGGVALSAVISAVLFLPVLLTAQREISQNGDYVTMPWSETWPAADLYSFVVPGGGSWYLGSYFADIAGKFIPTENTFLGWTILLLALAGTAGFYHNRKTWFWVAAALIFAGLALGPYIVAGGEMTHIPGPYMILQKIPLLNSTRVPGRFSLISVLALSVLAGYGITSLTQPIRRWKHAGYALPVLAAVVATFMFYEYRPMISLTSTRAPQVYEEIAASDTQGSMIVVPMGWDVTPAGSGHEMTFVQLYQPVHQRPMVGGMVARAPKKLSVDGIYTPVLDFLAEPQTYEPSDLDRDPELIRGVMEKYQVAFIVVHKKTPDIYKFSGIFEPRMLIYKSPEVLPKLDAYVTTYLGMEKFSEDDEYVAYRRK